MAGTKHVAVLMGGWSAERPVSLSSGKECADALEEAGYRVTRVDVGRDIAEVLAKLEARRRLQRAARPVRRGRLRPGRARDPRHSLHAFRRARLGARHEQGQGEERRRGRRHSGRRAPHRRSRFEAAREHVLPPPYVVKPIAEGSSFGVLIVPADQAHPPQSLARDDWPFGDEVMVERYVAGRELTCAVLGDEALGVIEIVPLGHGFYDYDAKYAEGGSKHICPAPLKPFVYQNVQRLALEAHRALGCRGVSRADFRYDEDGTGDLICLEVNTQPGMTRTSLVPEMAAHAGHGFPELVAWMVEDASCRR